MTEAIDKRYLENGIPVLMEPLPHLHSASLGVWVNTGTRDEHPDEHGVSHFLEHTFFKGSTTRDAMQIAREMDAMGGEMNAFTSREQTAFYVKVLSDRLHEATDLLCDILTRPAFEADALDKERKVVLEEIRMVEDDPEEWVHDLHSAQVWGEHSPLGRTILGTEDSVSRLDAAALRAYVARRYRPDRMVVTAAGGMDPDALFAQLSATIGQLPAATTPDDAAEPVPGFGGAHPQLHFRELEQVHLCIGARGLPVDHTDRFGMYVLSDLLGGGSSSRLFQEIREQRGLAYSVYCGLSSYRDTGEFTLYAATGKDSADKVAELMCAEIERICATPATAEEMDRIKGHIKGQIVLGMESTYSRMSRMAQDQIYWGAPQPIKTVLAGIDAVDPAQVLRLARRAFDPAWRSATVLGALDTLPKALSTHAPVPR
ncbi:MAG: M16 family metallopeptidase [Leptospirillia bacterium]